MTENYPIAEVVTRTGLTGHTLRYYERAGLIELPAREWNRHRRHTEGDLGMITILTKLRATGMPVEGMRRYAALCRQGPGNEAGAAHCCSSTGSRCSAASISCGRISRSLT